MFINKEMDTEEVDKPTMEYYLATKKKKNQNEIMSFEAQMDGPGDYHTE